MLPTEKLLLERISRPQTKSSLLAALASATPHTQSRTPPPNITKSKLSRIPQSLHCQKSDPTQRWNWAPSTEPISSKTALLPSSSSSSSTLPLFPREIFILSLTPGNPGWPCPVPSPRGSQVTCRVAGQAGQALGCAASPWEASPLLPGSSIYVAARWNPGGGKGEAGKPPRCWAGPARCLSGPWCWFCPSVG